MTLTKFRCLHWLLLLFITTTLTACDESPSDLQLAQRAMSIEHDDECHLCGMIIQGFPGPKGQLYERSNETSLKFCSTRDMFSYILDPEHQHAIQTVYVHDMATLPWGVTDDEFYIDARQAWYVIGHSKKGAMGPTLASFKDKQIAHAFSQQYGGQLYQFDDITQEILVNMTLPSEPEHNHGHH